MPLYNAAQNVPAIYPGDSISVFNAEAPAAGQVSQQVNLPLDPLGNPASLSVELLFSANPGAYEFDIVDADTDIPDAYVPIPAIGQMTVAQAGVVKFVDRREMAPIKGKFAALRCVTPITNGGVTMVAKFSR